MNEPIARSRMYGHVVRALHDSASTLRWAGTRNIQNQERLFRDIWLTHADSNCSVETVSERLGIAPAELEDAVAGKTDLTMTELRLLATACELVIDYRVSTVQADAFDQRRLAREVIRALDTESKSQDGESDWESEEMLDFPSAALANHSS